MKYIIDIPDEYENDYISMSPLLGKEFCYPIRNMNKTYVIPTGLKIEPYTEPDGVKNNKVNLCDSCNYIYPECPSERYDVMFGDGVGKDNICCCAGYRAINEQEIKQKVENEVWDFSMKTDFAWISEVGDKPLGDYSYQEAKAKYDAWRAERDEIRVGDEVIYNSRTKAVVLIPETKERYGTILTSEFVTISVSHDDLEKTGRHFDAVEKLLEEMRSES